MLAAGLLVGGFIVTGHANRTDAPGYAVRLALPQSEQRSVVVAQPRTIAVAEIEPAPMASPEPAPVQVQTKAADASPQTPGLLAVRYSLAGGAKATDAIEVEKPVSVGGTDAGRIVLRIDGNARVYALGSRLAAIIAQQSGASAVPAGLGEDFVSLDALRALGIAVRYDAIRDRLLLDPPAV